MATAKSLATKCEKLWARYEKKPTQNLLAEVYDLLADMEDADDPGLKSTIKRCRARAEKESAKVAKEIRKRGGIRPPPRSKRRSNATERERLKSAY
jgi:hypothetical protein